MSVTFVAIVLTIKLNVCLLLGVIMLFTGLTLRTFYLKKVSVLYVALVVNYRIYEKLIYLLNEAESRGAITKQYQTRSFDQKVANEQSALLINISTNNIVETSPPRNKNIISGNMTLNDNSEVSTMHASSENRTQNSTLDHNEINRLIESNITRILQNVNIDPNRVKQNTRIPPAR